ncbi:hypothetical protein LAJ19_16910 (plasmid) [Deinococcus taeanensis]|uniref:carboxylesterase family protein n=1 Tax=Deinococcus taeanensis TaxID=2737050 RepID=UPI001CDC4F09|nr:PHB depolymerase family esterase [Deinococcus taeanensis]UBV44466.1 hypothetical protein LAJ19_16910 [Deinococcus taeanensis]
MRNPVLTTLLSTLLVAAPTHASRLIDPTTATAVPGTGGQWTKRSITVSGFSLPYQLYTPTTALAAGKLPLIIHLHGSGEAGIDNEKQLLAGTRYGPQYFTLPEHQQVQAAYVLAPQTPVEIRWASTGIPEYNLDTTPETVSMTALIALIAELLHTHPDIDPDRVYLAGLSRGGQGVWNALMRHPGLFAAAVPISASGSPAHAAPLKNLAIWAFHAQDDRTTKVEYTRNMVDAIFHAGGETRFLRYTEVEYGDHQAGWETAYRTSEVYRWLIKWRR